MKKTLYRGLGILLFTLAISSHAAALAPVSGYAHSFVTSSPLPHALITILETGQRIETDEQGNFGPFYYPVGKPLTMEFTKTGYKTTQSGTYIVPPEGLNTPDNNITFQIPSLVSFYLLKTVIGVSLDDDACHVVTTITAPHKLLSDCPHGIAGAQLMLSPSVAQSPYYFGVFSTGPMSCKTNPFAKHLQETTEDGGAGFANVPPRAEPYTLSAVKSGERFTSVQFICRRGAFINISPPRGPKVLASAITP